jgi:hypothetical protein
MVIIIPTSPGLRTPGLPIVKDFPRPKNKSRDQEPYNTFKIHHEVEGLVKVVHFTGPTVNQYPFLETANELLSRLERTTTIENPDNVSEEDYDFLKVQKSFFEKVLAKEVGMQPSAYKKANEVLRLVQDEIQRLTPEPVQRFKPKR